jgi:type IV pilus assembly protein PilQ
MKRSKFLHKKPELFISIAVLIALIFGCASDRAGEPEAPDARHITDIIMSEDSEAVSVDIKANNYLVYSSLTQVFPRGVLFQFPDTSLGSVQPVYSPLDNEIIGTIRAEERVEEQKTKTRIFIAIKKDVPFEVKSLDGGLRVYFPKPVAVSVESDLQQETAAEESGSIEVGANTPDATMLETVAAETLEDKVVVNVRADGAIRDYRSFTLESPPRIVIDMFNMKSLHETQQVISLKSRWVDRVRHFGYPDKIRLVLDTHQNFLSNFSASPADSGLVIQVGNLSGSSP